MIPTRVILEAVDWLAADGFIAYPTETVWGLGACADRPAAIERLLAWKGRASDAPLAVGVDSIEGAIALECEIDRRARRLMEAFWPGPLTIVVPCHRRFAPGVARDDGALGLRCSSHPLARALCVAVAEAGLGPLTSTSLNRSGEAPASTIAEARAMEEKDVGVDGSAVPRVVFAAGCEAGQATPSSVVDCTGARPEILREGAIDRDRLEESWAD
jgi:L-threonylcarbamoyladenylate synthase